MDPGRFWQEANERVPVIVGALPAYLRTNQPPAQSPPPTAAAEDEPPARM